MKTTSVGQHGLQFTRALLFNCFLVREDDGWTLIDANLKGTGADILRAAGAPSIRRILLTHPHVDHVGSVDELAAAIPGLIVATSRRSVPMMNIPPDRSLLPGEGSHPIKGATPGVRTPVSLLLEDGQRVGSLLAVATPGHIPGHLSFLDERDGTLYAGDAMGNLGKLCVTGFTPWWFPLNKCWDKEIARRSVQSLRNLPIRRIACGHGKTIEGGLPLLEEALVRARP
ncbi:MBL fold metallo-hydrolase [Terriglobus roseus]|uniref:Glyoxylase, beta-lactamase superfamily II n=1 Tax=Terriglobus roseus TaxID=392734 RepID=A0A1G7K4L5_9BACT|nr:MBL fold metallo-hydrolase [Terriglobus roseus]SDF32183.1 Glyoxylase, beta-lactamase superfamily II [Terriglobus roseus]